MNSIFHTIRTLTYNKRPYRRTNLHLRDIINTTGAKVEFPTEWEVEHELSLKRIYSVHGNWRQPKGETI